MSDQYFLIRWDTNWQLNITTHDTVEDAKTAASADVAPAIIVLFEWIGKDLKSYTIAFRNVQIDKYVPRETWTDITHRGSSDWE